MGGREQDADDVRIGVATRPEIRCIEVDTSIALIGNAIVYYDVT